MTLREKQSLFAKLIAQLMTWIFAQGWEITCGDFNRPDHLGHMQNSCHYIRLAADLNLFVNGQWVSDYSPEWQQIGDYWKTLDAGCRWGGDFQSKDLNHFSIENAGFM